MDSLDGIRVLDLTQFLSASYTTQILGDLGADVIKVEPPGQGEVYRHYGPKFIGGESTSFLSLNRNKRSLAVNLKDPRSRPLMKRLAESADVLVENFRPGKLKAYGLDYPSLCQLNPRLIYCSISGFGQTGPYAERGGFDLVAQGMSGLMAVTGEADGPPLKVGYPITDIGAGMYAAIGILAALAARGKSGRGQWVDTSLFESGVAWGMMAALNYFADGSVQGRMGSASPQNAPYQAFRAKDGVFNVGTGNDALWIKFCQAFNLEALLQDPRYRDNAGRVAHQSSLSRDIEEAVKELPLAECIRRLEEAGIPNGPIYSIDEVLEDPQVQARGLVLKIDHPKAGSVLNLAFPVQLSQTPARVRSAPPLLGEHSEEILLELGFGAAKISRWTEDGVIGKEG